MIDKFERDGKVAVLISTDYGAGWYTWNTELGEQLLFDPEIVLLVLEKKSDKEIHDFCSKKYPTAYCGGADDLEVEWVDKGEHFHIQEYDGAETLLLIKDLEHIA